MKHLVASAASLVALVLLAACTTANPGFVGRSGDLGGLGDLAGADGGTADAAPGDLAAACSEGARSCQGATVTAVCTGGMLVADRTCPMDSMCQDGACTPPANGQGTLGNACDGFGGPSENSCLLGVGGGIFPSCQPFVVDNQGQRVVDWVCGRPIGPGGPGEPCTDGTQCRSGFCTQLGVCFRACRTAADCPSQPGRLFACPDVTLVVDGVSATAGSCVVQ